MDYMGQLQSNPPDESIGDDSIAVGVANDSIAVNGGFTANESNPDESIGDYSIAVGVADDSIAVNVCMYVCMYVTLAGSVEPLVN